jgi:hypothetical protein
MKMNNTGEMACGLGIGKTVSMSEFYAPNWKVMEAQLVGVSYKWKGYVLSHKDKLKPGPREVIRVTESVNADQPPIVEINKPEGLGFMFAIYILVAVSLLMSALYFF